MVNIDRTTIGLKDLIDRESEEDINNYLSSFSCDDNPDVADFINNKAFSNEKRDFTRSFLVVNGAEDQESDSSTINRSNIIGFFSLYIKSFQFGKDEDGKAVSKTCKGKLSGNRNGTNFSAILICQFARSDQYKGIVSGSSVMDDCLTTARGIYDLSALRVVCVEFNDDNPELDKFYLDKDDAHGNPKNFQFTYLQTEKKSFGNQKLAYLILA